MNILFMGTPEFAAEMLDETVKSACTLCGAVTQPDKPRGRGYEMSQSAVKKYALAHNIEVFQPETLKDNAFLPVLEKLKPELIVVAAYGKILPPYVLDYPKYGCINVHASLLPAYRGAAPIQRAIINGEKATGVTIMKMEKGLDTGDMLLKENVGIDEDDNFETVHDKLVICGRRAVRRAIELIISGKAVYTKQDEALATYADKITKEDCLLNFDTDAASVHNRIRGLSPVPLAFTYIDGKMIKILSSDLINADLINPDAEPGTVVKTDIKNSLITVACRKGLLGITSVLPEGKKRMSAADFLRGHPIAAGTKLGYTK